nr:MAG TPA: hypothetical protein [Caudoviricetes sp.]
MWTKHSHLQMGTLSPHNESCRSYQLNNSHLFSIIIHLEDLPNSL